MDRETSSTMLKIIMMTIPLFLLMIFIVGVDRFFAFLTISWGTKVATTINVVSTIVGVVVSLITKQTDTYNKIVLYAGGISCMFLLEEFGRIIVYVFLIIPLLYIIGMAIIFLIWSIFGED